MEAQWIAQRATLRCLARQHPQWTQEELAICLGRSVSWVRKWLKRFDQAPADALTILRTRRTPPSPSDPRTRSEDRGDA